MGLKFLYAACTIFIGWLACLEPTLARPKTENRETLSSPRLIPKNQTDLQYKYSYSNQYFEDAFNRDLLFKLGLDLKAEKHITDSFRALGKLELLFERGNVQGLQREDNRKDNGVYLSEAYLNWNPSPSLDLKAGALDQKDLRSPLLISSQTFPAINESLTWKIEPVEFTVFAQQAVPTSARLSTKTVEKEPMPRFYTAGGSARTLLGPTFKVYGQILGYQFHDLPSHVAHESRLYGNLVRHRGLKHAEFTAPFEGYTTLLEGQWTPNETWDFNFSTHYVENIRASKDRGKGVMYAFRPSYSLSSKTSISLELARFVMQTDPTPAYYNSWTLGHNNRKGYSVSLETHLKSHGLKLGGLFVQSQVLRQTEHQRDQNYFLLKMETAYESL